MQARGSDFETRPGVTPVAIVALAVILALAAFLRFWSLPNRGLIYWDEGKFALEGVRLEAALQNLFGSHTSLIVGKAVGTAKPTHALLIGLVYLLVGVHDYAPLWLDTTASLLQIAVVFVLARRLFGTRVALVGAVLLAVSEYDVIYARSALSESDGNMLFTAGALLWTSGRRRVLALTRTPMEQFEPRPGSPIWAALLMGLSFTVNYRLIVYIAVVVGFDLLWTWHESNLPTALRRVLPWMLGLAVAPVAWQIVDVISRVNGLVLFRSEANGQREWYLRQAFYQIHEGKQSLIRFSPVPYLEWYVVREGWPVCALIVAGGILALGKRSFDWLCMAALVILPYVIYVFAPFIVPRNLDATLPFASILAAAALVSIVEKLLGHARGALVGILAAALLLAAYGGSASWRLTGERSGFARAATFVQSHGQGRALTSNEVMVFYLRGSGRRCHAPPLPGTVAHLSADTRAGYLYAVLDHYKSTVSEFIRHHGLRVVRYRAIGPISIGENPISSENTHPPDSHAAVEYVDVFALAKMRLPSPGHYHAGACDRDRPV